MNNPFKRFWLDEEEQETDLDECRQLIELERVAYYPKLLAYLERGADAFLETGDATKMIRSAERINTFKEIRLHLLRQVKSAKEILDAHERG